MPAPTITEISSNDVSVTRTGAGWSHNTPGYCSSGQVWISNNVGDTMTVPFTGRAIYANFVTTNPANAGSATMTLDGASIGTIWTANATASGTHATVLTPLARNLSDGAHTLVLTTVQSTLQIRVDSFLVLSGAKGTPVQGTWSHVGDSWSDPASAGGTAWPYFGWTVRAQQSLQAALGRTITLQNYARSGECYHGLSGSNTPTGGLYRLTHQLAASQPEFLSMQYGVNDLSTARDAVTPSDFLRHVTGALSWIEDAYDTTQTRVLVATPGAIWSYYYQPPASADRYELGVRAVHNAVAARPWCNLVPIYEAMVGHPSLITTASGADFGLHPNEEGHGMIASEYVRVMALAAQAGAALTPVHPALLG